MALALWIVLCAVWICSREYSCKALNDGNDRHFRLSRRIRRNVPSCGSSQGVNITDSIPEGRPPIVKGNRHLEDFVDRDFTLKCFAYSRTPANITWVANGNRVKPGDVRCRYCISIPLGSPCYQQLVIKTAETADSGNYTCVVSNKYGTVNSTSSVTVRVKSLGKISIAKVGIEGGNQTAVLGGSINITCTIIDTSGTRPLYQWEKNGIRASDNGKTLIWNHDGMSPNDKREKIFLLILKNISVEDEGNYTCKVKGGKPAMAQSKMFTLRTEPCPGGYYCPWRENKKYPCPYGTYTNGSSNGTVLSPRDCLKCPGVTQGIQPKIGWQPAASLGGCPAAFNTCPENYYCYNRTSILPCPRGKYFEWRNATDVSDCKECPRDAGQLEGGSKALIDRCEDLIPSVKPVTYAEKPGNLDIIFGVLGGTVVIVMVIFVFLHQKCGFFSRASHSRFITDVGMKNVHKKSCQYHQNNFANRCAETSFSDGEEDAYPILYDVFITYSSKDGDWVRSDLLENLESRGFKCCIDIRDFLPGNAIVSNIAEAVYQSKSTLAVLSPDFIKSEWCIEELQRALCRIRNHKVVPVLYRVCEVPVELRDKTYVDWENPDVRPHFWDALERSLNGVIGQCSCFCESEIKK